jgi:hypothetical protein
MAAEAGQAITWWAIASAFGGTLIGAVLGGLTSYVLQSKSLAATKSLHDLDRTEVRKALGYALLFKIIRLCSDLAQLGLPVSKAVEAAQRAEPAEQLWPVVMPVLPQCDPIKFSSEEMALILSLDGKLFNDMAALDDLHNSAITLFKLYAEKRNSLLAPLQPAHMIGNMGTTLLTKEDWERMKPQSIELDILIDAMIERTLKDGVLAWACLTRLHDVLEKEFNLKHKLEIKEEYRAAIGAETGNPPASQTKKRKTLRST